MTTNIGRLLASAALAAILALGFAGCGNSTSSSNDAASDDTSSTTSSSSTGGSSASSGSSSSSSSSSSHTPMNADTRSDGMTYQSRDEDGYSYYEYSDGSAEITDGYGNVGRDSDGDGTIDELSYDSGETWESYDD